MGDLCNLRCRMCSPTYSSGLLAEYTALFGPRKDAAPAHGDGAWYRSEAFLEELRRLASRLVFINFAGGEPWLVADTFKLLRMLVDTGRAGHIRLSFNTNATRVPPEAYELFPRFGGVAVHCSVDGFGRVNDYIRSPSRWEDVAGVLRELDRERARLNLNQLNVSTVVQAYNVLGLRDLVRFLQEDFVFLSSYPILNPVSGQPHLDVGVLPPEHKEEAAGRLKELRAASWSWQGSLSSWVHGAVFRKQADAVLSRLRAPGDARAAAEFIRVTRGMDGFRGQSLADCVPELGGLLRGS